MRRHHIPLILLALIALPYTSIGQSWPGFANDPQHTALSSFAAQPLNRVLWSTPLVLSPVPRATRRYFDWLPSPLVTSTGVVIVMVRTRVYDGFLVQGRNLSTGAPIWTEPTDYVVPLPAITGSPVLRADGSVVFPGVGGTVYVRESASEPNSKRFQDAFYGMNKYLSSPAPHRGIQICTPLLGAPDGSVYFGYVSSFNEIPAGIARVTPGHGGAWISASVASGDNSVTMPLLNSAPALSLDGKAIYAVFRKGDDPYFPRYLVKLDSTTLKVLARVRLKGGLGEDPIGGATASPMIGPDGEVYLGVYSGSAINGSRGWMLHFTSDLVPKGWPGPFGWDCTPSLVPASIVPSYTGTSKYLILTKYNSYYQGVFRCGIFDPNDHEYDPLAGTEVMRLVLATPVMDQEWCVNTVAVDPITKSAIMNNEDGYCYRWDFTTNSLSERVQMTEPIGEAYTPTVIAPNGISLAIKNGTLFAIGR